MTQEVYALATNRSAASALAFLAEFLPKRIPFADEYPVPECADDPSNVFATPEDLMAYLEANPTEAYGLYWNSTVEDGPIRQAMLFHTIDKHLILGLAVAPSESRKLLEQLVVFAGTGTGILGCEDRPPETAAEFVAMARSTPRG